MNDWGGIGMVLGWGLRLGWGWDRSVTGVGIGMRLGLGLGCDWDYEGLVCNWGGFGEMGMNVQELTQTCDYYILTKSQQGLVLDGVVWWA